MLKVLITISAVMLFSAEALAEIRIIPIDSKSFRKCVSCHTIEEGGKNKMGPNLWNIMNRGIGQMENYKYSKKFSAWASVNPMWTPSLMDEWLTKSRNMVKGTRMNFRERKESKRAATIVYLRSMGVSKTEQEMIP
jgi:cytochrome c